MAVRRRARGDDQKRERRQAILDAAWELYQTVPFQAITMAQLAERLGLSKGTLYLYFKTKEELFMAIQMEKLEEWLSEVESELLAWEGTADTAGVLQVIRASVPRRISVVSLLAILHSILEHNVEFDSVLEFKRRLAVRMGTLGARLEACLPYLHPGEGARFVLHAQALMIGLLQHAEPAPVVRQVLQAPGVEVMSVDYLTEVMVSMELLLHGLESRRPGV